MRHIKRGIYLNVFTPSKGERANPSWSDYVRGEWWIDRHGQAEFADIDVGESGHEQLAINAMLDKEILIEGLLKSKVVNSDRADELLEKENDVSAIYFSDLKIPDKVGEASVVDADSKASKTEVWKEIKKDVRVAYCKHYGAILGINREFAAWQWRAKEIKAIQDFVFEQAQGEEIDPGGDEISIEELKTDRYVKMSFDDFVVAKNPRDLWNR